MAIGKCGSKTRLIIIAILCIIHSILQVLDGSFTYWGVYNFTTDVEGNPFIVLLIEQFGLVWGLLLAKLSGVGVAGFFYHLASKHNFPRLHGQLFYMLSFVNIVYFLVVLNWFMVWLSPESFGLL